MVSLYNPPVGSSKVTGSAGQLNHFDPDTNIPVPGGSRGNVFNGITYTPPSVDPQQTFSILSDTPSDDDGLVMSAKTRIRVPVFPTVGPYAANTNVADPNLWTMGVHSSDGFLLRVWKVPNASAGFGVVGTGQLGEIISRRSQWIARHDNHVEPCKSDTFRDDCRRRHARSNQSHPWQAI